MKVHYTISKVLLVLLVMTPRFFQEPVGGPDTTLEEPLRTVEDLVEIGFSRSQVVIVNEAHNGLSRCMRTRQVGRLILPRAHAAGVRHIAMEALHPSFAEKANRTRRLPKWNRGYLAQADMRALMRTALDLGWTLVPYEADLSKSPKFDDTMSQDATNWRELEQARNLAHALETLGPDARLLVWCGNSHLEKKPIGNWKPMASQFWHITGIEPFSIDQTFTIAPEGPADARARPWIKEFGEQLQTIPSGTMGFLREDWKQGSHRAGVDALVISLHNTLK